MPDIQQLLVGLPSNLEENEAERRLWFLFEATRVAKE